MRDRGTAQVPRRGHGRSGVDRSVPLQLRRQRRRRREAMQRSTGEHPEDHGRNATIEKICSGCKETKLTSAFHRNRSCPDGLQRTCKECQSRHQKANRQAVNRRSTEWKRNNPNSGRNAYLLRRYGMTDADYSVLLLRQSGLCAICERPPAGTQRLAVDHCHSTGAVRGLLCGKCNRALGFLSDSPLVLASAIRYLENAKAADTAD